MKSMPKNSIVVIVIVLLIASIGLIFYFKKDGNDISVRIAQQKLSSERNSTKTIGVSREISFTASDGYLLKGTFWIPRNQSSAAAIILVHQFNSSRHDFDDFVPLLLGKGYAVLAYDIRGFGESNNGPVSINDFPLDVAGAVVFLREQSEIAVSKIGIIGASVGANVAFVASGSIKEIEAAISLSPSDTGSRGVLMGTNITPFAPRNIFIASDEREKRDADVLYALSGNPKKQKVYPGFGHGKSLLKSPQARNDIIKFLEQTLLDSLSIGQ